MLYLAFFIIYTFIFVFGICIGSFLNVAVYRLPNHISIAYGRSFCPKCHKQIPNRDLIPIFRYLHLKGLCRNCQAPISPRYPLVEAFTGLLAVGLFWYYGFNLTALVIFSVACILTIIALIDIDTMTIPNNLLIALSIPAVLIYWFFPEISLLARIIGFFAVSLPMFLLNFIKADAMGGGDIKLMAVSGFMLGWQNILLAMFIALLASGLAIVYLLAAKQKTTQSHIAFGPYLCLGIITALVYGKPIIELYFAFFNLY